MKSYQAVIFAYLVSGLVLIPGQSQAENWIALPPQSVTLAWSPSPDKSVVGYFVYCESTYHRQTNRFDAGASLTLTVPNLQAGLTYRFYATAYDAANVESEPSNLINYTPAEPPAAPSELTAAVAGYYSVALNWQRPAADVDGFYVERSLDGQTFARIATADSDATSFELTDPDSYPARNYPYCFRVNAFRGTQESPYSNLATAVTNRPDLVVTALDYAPKAPVAGQPVSFQAIVRNRGQAATPLGTEVQVGFTVDGAEMVASGRIADVLLPGASATVELAQGLNVGHSWTATPGWHTVNALVDTWDVLAESDEANNTASITMAVALSSAPSLSLQLDRAEIGETVPTGARVTITRTGSGPAGGSAPLVVNLAIGGTARGGVDFVAVPSQVVIPAGQNAISFQLRPIHNRFVSPDKTVILGLIPDTGYQFGSANSVVLQIANQDVDSDQDGMSDAAEQLAGTSARDASSNLKVTAIQPAPNGWVVVTWASVPGVTYRVLSRDSLAAADWTPVSPPVTASATATSWRIKTTNRLGVVGIGLHQ